MMSRPKALARTAGALYLGMSVCFVVAGSLRSQVVGAHPEAAAGRIRDSVILIRVSLAVDLLSAALFLLTAAALYLLLEHVNRLVAAAMVVCVALSVGIECMTLVNQYAALIIATHADYARALGQAGSDALVMLFSDLQGKGLLVDELFWGLWLLPLGYLVVKSGWFPRLVGVLLIVGGFAWLAQLFVSVLAPDLRGVASALTAGAIGELVFIVWLLVKGVEVLDTARPS